MNVINAVASKAKIISISHQCPRGFDIRALQHALDESSYHQIRPQSVLSSFTFSNFADKVFAPGSIDIAVSGRELSELQGTGSLRPIHSTFSQAQDRERLADKEFTIWLKARAAEVKPGGLLVCFFCIRTCPLPDKRSPGGADSRCDPRDFIPMSPPRSPRHAMDRVMFRSNEDTPFVSAPPLPSPPMTHGEVRPFRPDIWRAMYHALSPAIQRLVTLGEISSHVAPVLVDVPFWPKTLASVKSTFARQQDWEVVREEEGGGEDSENRKAFCIEERQEWSNVGVRIHRLIHPAWKAYQDGEIDRASYARRVASYCRSGESCAHRFDADQSQSTNHTLRECCERKDEWMSASPRRRCKNW